MKLVTKDEAAVAFERLSDPWNYSDNEPCDAEEAARRDMHDLSRKTDDLQTVVRFVGQLLELAMTTTQEAAK